MPTHKVVSEQEWVTARKALLEKEKALDQQRDALAAERRALPWRKVEKDYVFAGVRGPEKLSELFAGKSQLFTYHFMYGRDWKEPCSGCSIVADSFDRAVVHLAARDISLVAVSRGPLDQLEATRKRMGWSFKWLSSAESDFNFDYHVSARTPEEAKSGFEYNYGRSATGDEAPGLSVFHKDTDGQIYHTYSTFGRGLDLLISTYNYLDLSPKGRNEEGLEFPMAWVRLRDRYETPVTLK